MRRVVVIGGGISGLSAAYYLAKVGVPSTIIESQPRLGGVIRTEQVHGCIVESGPDSFLAAKPWALELIRDVGLGDEVIGSNDHLRVTYIWKHGKLIPLPDGLMMMVPTRIAPLIATRLLSWSTKARMGLEYFRRPNGAVPPDRSVAEFIGEHYGAESVDYLAEPLLSGVYGGDPTHLSASSVLTRFVELETKYGSLTRGVLASMAARHKHHSPGGSTLFRTLKGGLGLLTQTLQERIASHATVIHGTAEVIERQGQGFQIRVNDGWLDADHLVLACPAYRAGGLIGSLDPTLSQTLSAIEYSSSLTLSLGYNKASFDGRLDGFGFLVPKRERSRMVACTWVGTKFSHRVPDNQVVLRCFFGGAADDAILDESDESLIEIALADLRHIMGVQAQPAFHAIARWPRSMAQYTVGHGERVRRIEERVKRIPGLHLAGNAYYGIGIPDCIRMGKEAAHRIARSGH